MFEYSNVIFRKSFDDCSTNYLYDSKNNRNFSKCYLYEKKGNLVENKENFDQNKINIIIVLQSSNIP